MQGKGKGKSKQAAQPKTTAPKKAAPRKQHSHGAESARARERSRTHPLLSIMMTRKRMKSVVPRERSRLLVRSLGCSGSSNRETHTRPAQLLPARTRERLLA